MTCTDYRAYLSAYLDRGLPPNDQRTIVQHVEGCAACQAEVGELLKVKELLRAAPMPAIPTALIAEIEAATVLRPTRWRRSESFWRWAPLAAGALALTVWSFTVYQNARLQIHEPRVSLQALLARRAGRDAPLENDQRVAIHRVTGSPPDDTSPPSSPPQP